MNRCRSEEAKIVGLLHDVVEDSDVTFEFLEAEGFSERVLNALRLLTHVKDVPYEEYVKAITRDLLAVEVKLADLEDNTDIRRLQELDERAVARLRRYLAAHRLLSGSQS